MNKIRDFHERERKKLDKLSSWCDNESKLYEASISAVATIGHGLNVMSRNDVDDTRLAS